MNLFTKYGIKEVANVMIYSIERIGDEEFYLPVLFLDTLKISDISKKDTKVVASSGYGNAKVMSWSLGKDITLKMQDALFTPASLSLAWGGWLDGKLSIAAKAIMKISVRNKYRDKNYSCYAYPSPELTTAEWALIYQLGDTPQQKLWVDNYIKNTENIEKNRVNLSKSYYRKENIANTFWDDIIPSLIEYIKNNQHNESSISTRLRDLEMIDRIEECIVKNRDLIIDQAEQQESYKKFLTNDYSSSFILYLDIKTQQPLYLSWKEETSGEDKPIHYLKPGTRYLKLMRSGRIPESYVGTTYGKYLTISADTFPKYLRIVGETKIREQATGQDQRVQFIIPKAKIAGDTDIKLEAAGDPTVFDMNIDVICPENGIMFELKQYNVEEDCAHGGTYIVPQSDEYTNTRVYSSTDTDINPVDDNDEIY